MGLLSTFTEIYEKEAASVDPTGSASWRLAPPFNSNRGYNVIFGQHQGDNDVSAQIQAFINIGTGLRSPSGSTSGTR